MITLSRIRLREIKLPLRAPFRISSGVVSDRRITLLELTDTNGITVWSECVAGEAPTYSSETSTCSSSTGSSMWMRVAFAASLRASAPAVWNAMSEESTECALPSTSVTRMSTTG